MDQPKKFFICDDHGGYYWLGVAVDREHFINRLREINATWETDDVHVDADIDQAIFWNLVEIRELTAEELEQKQRCHTEDERGVIPLVEARLGDLFCSEW